MKIVAGIAAVAAYVIVSNVAFTISGLIQPANYRKKTESEE